ncbi:MAG: CCDC90 family protein [Magnetococcus sp. YQC-9]
MTTAVITFDTLAFVKELEIAGVPAPQAEAQVRALTSVLQQVEESRSKELAKKGDVLSIKNDIVRLDNKIDFVEANLKTVIESSKADILKWVAGMFVAQTALILGVLFGLLKGPTFPSVHPSPVAQEMRLPAPVTPNPTALPPAR